MSEFKFLRVFAAQAVFNFRRSNRRVAQSHGTVSSCQRRAWAPRPPAQGQVVFLSWEVRQGWEALEFSVCILHSPLLPSQRLWGSQDVILGQTDLKRSFRLW